MKPDWEPHVCTIYRHEVWGCECTCVATTERVDKHGKVWRVSVSFEIPHLGRESRAIVFATRRWESLYGDQSEDLEQLNQILPRDEWPRECWNSTGDCGPRLRKLINSYHQERE